MIPLSNLERLQLRIGYHEAGHVAAAIALGIEISHIEMDHLASPGQLFGSVTHNWISLLKAGPTNRVILSLAGPLADCRHRNARFFIDDFPSDAAQILAQTVPAMLKWTVEKHRPAAEAIVAESWPQIERLARRIARLPRLGRLEAVEIMAIWRDGQKI